MSSDPFRILPDGAVDVLWAPGRAPWIAGPDTQPARSTLPPGTGVTAVRLRVGSTAALIKGSAASIVNERISLQEVLDPRLCRRLTEELEEVDQRHGNPAIHLANSLDTIIGTVTRPHPDVVRLLLDIEAGGRPRPPHHLGERQLRRRFIAEIGYGPKLYERIRRLDRFVSHANLGRPLATSAHVAGYYDQPHLNRDCLALAGCTPGELMSELSC